MQVWSALIGGKEAAEFAQCRESCELLTYLERGIKTQWSYNLNDIFSNICIVLHFHFTKLPENGMEPNKEFQFYDLGWYTLVLLLP